MIARFGALGAALTVAVATTALVLTGPTAALAGPNDPMTNSLVRLCTGNDDKRQDSEIALNIDTVNGTMRLVLSPSQQNVRLPDRTCTNIPVNLFPLRPADITGFRLEWIRGTTDNTSPDSWWFTGLAVTGINTALEAVELIDASGIVPHKFEANEVLPIAGLVPLRGVFTGTITPPNQAPQQIQVTFVSFGGLVGGTAQLPGMLLLNVCNMDIAIPPVTVMLTGRREFVDAAGASHYVLEAPLQVSNFMVTLRATIVMSPDGRTVRGTVTIENLPWPCGGPQLDILLTKAR